MRRLTRVLLANVELCDAEKLRRTCRGVDFVCSRSGTDAIPSRLPAEFCHSLVQTLTAGPPCFRTTIAPFQPAHEKVTFGMIWSDGASFFILNARLLIAHVSTFFSQIHFASAAGHILVLLPIFVDVRVFQSCTCDQCFNLKLLPDLCCLRKCARFPFRSHSVSTLWLSLCALCRSHD